MDLISVQFSLNSQLLHCFLSIEQTSIHENYSLLKKESLLEGAMQEWKRPVIQNQSLIVAKQLLLGGRAYFLKYGSSIRKKTFTQICY